MTASTQRPVCPILSHCRKYDGKGHETADPFRTCGGCGGAGGKVIAAPWPAGRSVFFERAKREDHSGATGTNSFWGELVIEPCHRRQFSAYKSVASGRPDKVRFRGLAKNPSRSVSVISSYNVVKSGSDVLRQRPGSSSSAITSSMPVYVSDRSLFRMEPRLQTHIFCNPVDPELPNHLTDYHSIYIRNHLLHPFSHKHHALTCVSFSLPSNAYSYHMSL